ncbi:GNAT family N-acetyltransferase [Oerskovia gallyi]|uniref:GNAT family N-acetyltransferase n=1 Tax=Oerskovia gallyi TaxID=2762226 RepID=A0ABR8V626_9CELL|nr:GNAT family protein [Oerskovia gallyi]MBD8000248.1 GNAT family N-acetyltransferase [Oerskovia gallyi]
MAPDPVPDAPVPDAPASAGTAPAHPTRTELWPPSGLRVVSGDLELRHLDEDLLYRLAVVGGEGIHDEGFMPFMFPWSRGSAVEVGRSILAYQWGAASRIAPASWAIELAVVRDGEVLGVQALTASDFVVTRTAESGSWLGRRHQGAGVGTLARLMILELLFAGFDARTATTSAWEDNGPSNGVTRKLGYRPNGTAALAREGKAAADVRYRLDREDWDARPEALRPEVTLHGVGPVREMLGLD